MQIKSISSISHTFGTSVKQNVPIFSVCVHPKLFKVATAGQDFKIRIWSTENILTIGSDPQSIESPSVLQSAPNPNPEIETRLLSTLTLHDGAVLTVRWSPDGDYLASGSDDQKIVIWKFDLNGFRSSFGEESYRPVRVLMGHESDVSEVAWSPDQVYLASCGFDSKVYIWDTSSFGKAPPSRTNPLEMIAKIEAHTDIVKGIAWDPAGKFLATQSDDKSVKIYRTFDWKVEKDIVAPYETGASTTFFRRLSWSPDGSIIATVNGENNGICVAPIIYREGWHSTVSLVGHEAPIEVSSFNPQMFHINDPKRPGHTIPTSVVALGSQDNGLSIWWTASSRAICSIRDLFVHSVLDLSWTPDGLGLYACSYDGTLVYIQFDANDFGSPLSSQEQEAKLSKYGSVVRSIVPESIEILEMEEKHLGRGNQLQKGLLADRMQVTGTNPATTTTAQVGFVFGGADIQLAPPPSLVAEIPQTRLESQREPQSQRATPTKARNTSSLQSVSIGKDGKKRIRPVLVETTRSNPKEKDKDLKRSAAANFISSAALPGKKVKHQQEAESQKGTESYVLPTVQTLSKGAYTLTIPVVKPFFSAVSGCSSLFIDVKHNCPDQVLLVKNNANGSEISMSNSDKKSVIWSTEYAFPCILATQSRAYTCLAFTDATLHIHSSINGRLILAPLKLPSAACFLNSVFEQETQRHFLIVADALGNIYVWDLEARKRVIKRVSMVPLLGLFITKVRFVKGKIVVRTAGNQGTVGGSYQLGFQGGGNSGQGASSEGGFKEFLYNEEMESWMQIQTPLTLMTPTLKLIDIELHLSTAIELQDDDNICYWYRIYAKRVVEGGLKTRAEEIRKELE